MTMYLARRRIAGRLHYAIRESYSSGGDLLFRELLDLGPDPGGFIVYPGGNSFYIDPALEDALRECGCDPAPEELETIFWPFIAPDIRWKLEPFRRREDRLRHGRAAPPAAPPPDPHPFDRRRLLFLKTGRMDPPSHVRLPSASLRALRGKSRDEIEQGFIDMEAVLRPRELKAYAYSIFDVQQGFQQRFARQTPEFLDRNQVDAVFTAALCTLQEDAAFWAGMPPGPRLNDYLVRYAVMYFDHEFESRSPAAAYIRDFINRHRDYRPPASVAVSLQEMAEVFAESRESLRRMSGRDLTRLYRRRAQELHPDKGGDHERFLRLAEAYEKLLRTKR
jgi:hypothetical protein